MINTEAPRGLLAKIRGNLTQEQATAFSKAMIVIGLGLIAKAGLNMWPSIGSVVIRGAIYAAIIIYGLRALRLFPHFQRIGKWFIPLCLGAALNFTVMLANGGYMPSVIRTQPYGIYIPLDGTNLTYLGDWIWRGMSPGDVLLIVAFFGIAATILKNWKKQPIEQEA